MNVYLGCSEPNTGRFVHGFQHIVDQFSQLSVKNGYWLCLGAQSRIGELQYV
jgi:hypothetical protein